MRGSSDLQPGRPADGLNRVVAPLVDATCRDPEGASRTMSGDSGPVQPTLLRWERRGRARRKIHGSTPTQAYAAEVHDATRAAPSTTPRKRWVAARAERRARSRNSDRKASRVGF